jgi:triacylglycerol lipase
MQLALAAKLSYEGLETIERESSEAGLTFFAQHNLKNHSVSFFQFPGAAVVAFRGTSEVADWKTNLLFIPAKRSWGWVHLGFARATDKLWNVVQHNISENFAQGRSLYFTGHSLGGAMAMISALKAAHEQKLNVAGLATFGQPPLAGKSTIQSLSAVGLQYYPRVVSSVDVVATGPFMPFFHSGIIHYFDANGHLHNKMSWLRYFKDAAKLGWRMQIDGQIKKHFMSNYISLIARAHVQLVPSPE